MSKEPIEYLKHMLEESVYILLYQQYNYLGHFSTLL